jgi:uncharacterized protein YkwD
VIRKVVSSALLAVLLFGSTVFAGLRDEEGRIFDLVNQERARRRLSQLSWDEDLSRLARDYSKRMAREGFFDHYDRQGRTVLNRAEQARLKGWSRIGENLFMCDPTDGFSRLAVRGWLRSPTHRDNMLDRDWTATGIGIAEGEDGQIYITEVFTSD